MRELEPQPIAIDGQSAWTFDRLPVVGQPAPGFRLVDPGFNDRTLADFAGKKKVLNVVPSLETPDGRRTTRNLIEALAARTDVVVLTISADLPFALARLCADLKPASGQFLSTFRSPEFGMDYGTLIVEHARMGLQAGAVIVIDERDVVRHIQLVPETANEPDNAAALAALE